MDRIEKVREIIDGILLNMKDDDVMQHVLYNPLCGIKQQEQERFRSLQTEFGLEC